MFTHVTAVSRILFISFGGDGGWPSGCTQITFDAIMEVTNYSHPTVPILPPVIPSYGVQTGSTTPHLLPRTIFFKTLSERRESSRQSKTRCGSGRGGRGAASRTERNVQLWQRGFFFWFCFLRDSGKGGRGVEEFVIVTGRHREKAEIRGRSPSRW